MYHFLFTSYTKMSTRVRCPTSECLKPSLPGFPPRLPGQAQIPSEHPNILSLATSPVKAPNEIRYSRFVTRNEPVTYLGLKLSFEKTLVEKRHLFLYADMLMPARHSTALLDLPGILVFPSLQKYLTLTLGERRFRPSAIIE